MSKHSSQITIQLQLTLAASVASFVRHRNYNYASSQELTSDARQRMFRNWRVI